jgi:hypothetical protein
MNQETNSHNQNGAAAALGFVMACFILAALILAMKHSAHPPAIDADNAATRAKALAELRAAEFSALNNPGWIDQNRGIVRLPISIALQISENEWQNPAAARSNLIVRAGKAAAPAPAAPAKPSPFE